MIEQLALGVFSVLGAIGTFFIKQFLDSKNLTQFIPIVESGIEEAIDLATDEVEDLDEKIEDIEFENEIVNRGYAIAKKNLPIVLRKAGFTDDQLKDKVKAFLQERF